MLVKMWRNWTTHSSLIGSQNGTASLEKVMPAIYKEEHVLTI